jgi:hypothetical protein
MALNKAGVAFTLISLLAASTLLTVFFIGDSTPTDAYTDSLTIRRETTENTVASINDYFEYHVQRSLKASLTTIIEATNNTGALYNDPTGQNTATTQPLNCFQHGIFTNPAGVRDNCTSIHSETQIIESFAENNTQTDIDITTENTVLTQSDPFYVDLTTTLGFTADDYTAFTEQRTRQTSSIPLRGLPSPLYRYTSTQPYDAQIQWANNLSRWTNQSAHRSIVNREFVHYDNAPSFLQRLENNTGETSDCCGMTSIVDPNEVNNPQNYSHLDHHFFHAQCGTNTRRIQFDSNDIEANYKGNASQPGIEGAILPMEFIERANLDDPRILEPVTCS